MVLRVEWRDVQRIERFIVHEIDPLKLLSILKKGKVLTERDCESIEAATNNYGPIHATEFELLMRLKRKGPTAFRKFVAALREVGFGHVAQLLDPKYEVTVTISNEITDERVLQPGVAADLRLKICLLEPTEEQVKKVDTFCEQYAQSHGDNAVKLRRHFSDFPDQDVGQFVNLVKTTSASETPLVFIFRLSKIDAAEAFWKDYADNGKLRFLVEEKLRSFPDENNCFKNEDIKFDIKVDQEDYEKVYHTLENPEECKVLVDGMEKQELKLRDYQLELAKPALKGKNAIICAPTGSGKTFVAMQTIKDHVTSPDHRYIAFIVPTVSLVDQQRSCLERYLPESINISCLCGSNPDISLPTVLKDNHVVVLTAQVLLNALKKKKKDNSSEQEESEVSISQFSLLVFDECHHTDKDHPYNNIMRWYMREKYCEDHSPTLPQILGLSASLGIGTGNNGSGVKAKEHILGLCANLDVHELQVYTEPQITCTNITTISRDRNNLFCETLSKLMAETEMMSSLDKHARHPYGSQPYENWVVNLRKENLGRDVLTCAEHLQFYNSALMINDEIRSEDALLYLEEKIAFHKQLTEVEVKLKERFNEAVAVIKRGLDDCEPNPGLQKLEELLCEKLDNLESKGIIFVGTRFVARALVDWLEKSEPLRNLVKNPTSVIGCGQRNGEGGMAKARQDNEIKKFRDGDCNVIVATSALLEGIDIRKCNFAINYSMPGNEITFVQARGRVRTQKSGDYTYDILVPCERRMLMEQDMNKEKLMKEVVEKIKKMRLEDFEDKVERIQKSAYKEYTNDLARKRSNRASAVPDDIEFCCRKCGVFACKAMHIKIYHSARIVPHYQENLHNASFVEDCSKKYMPGDFSKTAKTYCAKCKQNWGNRAKNEYGEFPLIKIEGFRVRSSSGTVINGSGVYKKWKEFPYELDEFDAETDANPDANDIHEEPEKLPEM